MLAISADSNHMAVLSTQNEVLLYDLVSGEMETMVTLETDGETNFNVMRKTPGEDLVLVGNTNQIKSNTVVMISINNCIIERTLMLKKQYTSIGFTDDMHMRLIGGQSSDNHQHELISGRSSDKHQQELIGGQTSDNHKQELISGQTSNKHQQKLLVFIARLAADVYNSTTGELLHEFDCKPDQAEVFGDDGLILLHPKQTNIYTIHDLHTYTQVHQITCDETPLRMRMNLDNNICCIVMNNIPIVDIVCFSKEAPYVKKATKIDLSDTVHKKIQSAVVYGNLCLISSTDGYVLWDIKTNKKKSMFIIPDSVKPKHRVLDFHSVLTPDGNTLVAGYDRCLIIWDVKSGKVLNITEATRSAIQNMMLSPCGQYIVHTCRRNNSIMTWKVAALMGGTREYSPFAMKDSARYLALDEAGETAIVRSHNSTDFAVIDLGTGGKKCTISESYEAMAPHITSNGQYAVLREYNSDSCLKIWDLETGTLVKSLNYTSLNLSGYRLGTKPETMAVITESVEGTKTINLCTVPEGEVRFEIPIINKVNIMQVLFVMEDAYCLLGVEEQQSPGVKIYAKCVHVGTGNIVREYPGIHPKLIQMITPGSHCFIGQQYTKDKNGENTVDLVKIDIETGEVIAKFDKVAGSILHIGDKGLYGIDKERFVYDIQKGKRCFQFDADEDYGMVPSRRLAPKVTIDEKHAVWVQLSLKLLKVGDIASKSVIGVCPLHSEAMCMEVSAKNVILTGCEDGRVMMIQLLSDQEDTSTLTHSIFSRSKRKHVLTHKSVTKGFQSITGKKEANTNGGGRPSRACILL